MCTASADRPDGAESICARPLGLQFHPKAGDLYIADAYLGLMKAGPGGGEAEVLATEAGGVPFNFVNGVDVDHATGDVYFTDSSTVYTRAHNTEIMIHRDAATPPGGCLMTAPKGVTLSDVAEKDGNLCGSVELNYVGLAS